MAENAPRARTRRWSGPLPEPVMRVLELVQSLGYSEEAQAALLALKPPKKQGGTPPLDPQEAIGISNAFRLRWRENPNLTVRQVCLAISKAHGGTISASSVRRRLERYCSQIGTTVAEWEAKVQAQEAERRR